MSASRAVELLNSGPVHWIASVLTQADLPLDVPIGTITCLRDEASWNRDRTWVKVSDTEWEPVTIITPTPEMRLDALEKRVAALEDKP